MAILKFNEVVAGYPGKDVLKGFSAAIERGEFVGLIGSNGTGKSTLIKCISGILPVTSGSIEVEGKNNAALKPRERAQMVAVVPQSFNIDYDFAAEEIVLMGRNPYLGFKDRESERDYTLVEQAMRMTKTWQFRGRQFNALSGGEKQRVILARAIAQEPDIILLDEPTSALDVHHQIEVMELIQRLNSESKMTVLAVLHDLNLASRFCKRLIMLMDGRVEADGTPEDVIIEENMQRLYNMRMVIQTNQYFNKPEVIPLRVLSDESADNPLRIHIICGGNGAVQLIEALDNLGHHISAGVLNEGSSDLAACMGLGLQVVAEKPFMPVSEEKQQENLELMAQADVVFVADIPFGNGNIRNLDGLERIDTPLYVCEGIADFTGGKVKERLEAIGKKKAITFVKGQDEFIKRIQGERHDDE